jgi:predicted TIM-barrel fold metal-dependent hydrolase
VRATLQPNDGPSDAAAFARLLELLGSDELLLFSTDYPHRQFGDAEEAIPDGIGDGLLEAILATNARRFYRLGEQTDG